MKKGLSLFLVFLFIFSTAAFAQELPSEAETFSPGTAVGSFDVSIISIVFQVGDATLQINGSPVTVEPPYVVGGTTLVPLRVITEAFGAQVDWKQESQTAVLQFEGTCISVQIGSKTALVNGREELLLEAPENKNGNTMVPLRFISQTFGATVDYEHETQKITVTKAVVTALGSNGADSSASESNASASNALGSIIKKDNGLAGCGKAKMGDIYWKWSMDLAPGTNLVRRSFSGRENIFTNSNAPGCLLYVEVLPDFNETSIPDLCEAEKNFLEGITVLEQEETHPYINGSPQSVITQATHDGDFYYRRATVKDGNFYYATLKVTGKGDTILLTPQSQKLKAAVDSFSASFSGSDIYNLSDEKGGYRPYENKDLNLSLSLPSSFEDVSPGSAKNLLNFINFDKTGLITDTLTISVCSKQDGQTLDAWAGEHYNQIKEKFNETLVTASELTSSAIGGLPAKQVTVTYPLGGNSYTIRDIFFENGDYFYHFSFDFMDKNQKIVDAILKTMQPGVLNVSEAGVLEDLVLTDPLNSVTYECGIGRGFGFSLPMHMKERTFKLVEDEDAEPDPTLEARIFYSSKLAAMFGVFTTETSGPASGSSKAHALYRQLKDIPEINVFKPQAKIFDGVDVSYVDYVFTADNDISYFTRSYFAVYICTLYEISFQVPNVYKGEQFDSVMEFMMNSFKFGSDIA